MGNTCASFHVVNSGTKGEISPLISQAISRAYTSIGYERTKKLVPGGKHVVLMAPQGQRFVSVFDSDNSLLDNGELKDAAVKATKALRSAAVFTSLYDSDFFEFILFANGRQVDCLMNNEELDNSVLKHMKPAARAKNWSAYFSQNITADAITSASSLKSAFADDAISNLSKLIGMSQSQSQMRYDDFKDDLKDENKDDSNPGLKHLFFKKKEQTFIAVADGVPSFSLTYDPFYTRMISVYPASWPARVGAEILPTWLIISNGAGFKDAEALLTVSGPEGLSLERIFANGCKFHNGQIVGPLETGPTPPAEATQEELEAHVQSVTDAKRFGFTAMEGSTDTVRKYSTELRNLCIPTKTAERTTQILITLQLTMMPEVEGDWEIDIQLRTDGVDAQPFSLPKLRIATAEKKWVPIVSGLNIKTLYDRADIEQTKTLFNANILREMQDKQLRGAQKVDLEHPAIASNVLITRKDPSSLNAIKTSMRDWLNPLNLKDTDTKLHLLTEGHLTAAGSRSKSKKVLTVKEFLGSKTLDKVFADEVNYQTVALSIFSNEFEHPIAGFGLQSGFREPNVNQLERDKRNLANTLNRMRGREFSAPSVEPAIHCFNWVIDHPRCYDFLNTSGEDMRDFMRKLAEHDSQLLQAWSSSCTWLPLFDTGGDYRLTPYEELSTLNWFRGILEHDGGGLHGIKMLEGWCENVLRMVAPHMWLNHKLFEQTDRDALAKVAHVNEYEDSVSIALEPGMEMDALELAMLQILPVESKRLRIR